MKSDDVMREALKRIRDYRYHADVLTVSPLDAIYALQRIAEDALAPRPKDPAQDPTRYAEWRKNGAGWRER
jgi:hypothetical protein